MASNKVPVAGQLGTTSPTDTYPVFEDVDGLGGFRVVADENDMNAIPAERRKEGMEVKLENGKLYELKNGIFVLKTSIGDIQPLLDLKEDKANKNQPNGYAGLGSDGKVLSSQLPSYVDDIVEYPNKAAFPTTGNSSTIYVDLSDNNKQYRWSGTAYAEISSGAVQSVNGKTGIVNLVKADIALGNVDNTSDLNKPISTATQAALDGKAALGHNHSGLYEPANANIQAHIADTSTNPHNVTKQQVGLGSVDNTSDLNKPISTATQTALDFKEDKANKGQPNGYAGLDANSKVSATNLPTFVSSVNTRSGDITLSKSDVGLNNVDNTADASKEVLSATKLKTPRTINGVAFDGTQNINIPSNAAGSNTQVMFNDNGVLAGSADFTYDKANKIIKVGSWFKFTSDNSGGTGVGYNCLLNDVGVSTNNTGFGHECLSLVTTGTANAGFGFTTLQNNIGSANTAIGHYALKNNTTGNNNVSIGTSSGVDNNGNNNIFLGYASGRSYTNVSNRLAVDTNLQMIDADSHLITGDFSQRWVKFNGAVMKRINNITAPAAALETGTVTSYLNGVITDTSKTFTVNAYSDKLIIITGGLGFGNVSKITSNTSNTITCINFGGGLLDSTSTYKIIDATNISNEKFNSEYLIDLSTEDYFIYFSNFPKWSQEVNITINKNPNNKNLWIAAETTNALQILPYKVVYKNYTTPLITHTFKAYQQDVFNRGYLETSNDLNNLLQPIKTSTKDLVIDLYSKIYKINVATATTVTFNIDSSYTPILTGNSLTIELDINMTVVSNITWPVNVTWIGGSAPTFASIAKYRLVFRTEDAGTTWLGNLAYTY